MKKTVHCTKYIYIYIYNYNILNVFGQANKCFVYSPKICKAN